MSGNTTLHKRPYRLPAWVSLMIFSIVVLAAMASRGFSSAAEKWVIALSSISIVLALGSIVCYLVPHTRQLFIGELSEGILAVFGLVLWVAGMPIIMNPSKTIAITFSPDTGLSYVWNANLYFFSWGSFFCLVFICGSILTENVVAAQEAFSSITSNSKLGKWFMLLVTSLVVMASAAQFSKSQCTDNDYDIENISKETCTSNKFAISLGAISFAVATILSIMTYMNCLGIFVETSIALFLFILYTAGVGVITFNFGSGVTIGNLYFSTWFGFMIAIFLLVECYQGIAEQNMSASRHALQGKESDMNGVEVDDTLPVEPIPEEHVSGVLYE